ncbi:MAG: PepSY-associated TM helix domain-containing protein [Planctomycetota bacterium]
MWQLGNFRSLNAAAHRDVGYFCSALIITYCVSGVALNHKDDWNPDFVITRVPIRLDRTYSTAEIDDKAIAAFGRLVGERDYKVYDSPVEGQVKIYYDNASLHLHLTTAQGVYERVSKRALFYQSNVLHRNSVAGWRWASDVFAIGLVLINVTGLFVLRGKQGISGRGKWLIAIGLAPPLIVLAIQGL